MEDAAALDSFRWSAQSERRLLLSVSWHPVQAVATCHRRKLWFGFAAAKLILRFGQAITAGVLFGLARRFCWLGYRWGNPLWRRRGNRRRRHRLNPPRRLECKLADSFLW